MDGGYRVTGRWGFGSGCTHADVMIGGCLVERDGAPPDPAYPIFVFAPVAKWEIQDTWYPTGLAGTGSHHYAAKDLFIPERHTMSLRDPPRMTGPLYDNGGAWVFFIPMVGTPLGLARRAIDTALALAREKLITVPPPPTLIKDLPRARFAFARAQMQWGAARAYVYETIEKLWDEMTSKGGATIEHAARRGACAHPRLPHGL